jgi:hypothetical protein
LDVLALTDELSEYHLRRGQVGTIVEIFADGKAFEVELCGREGRTYESLVCGRIKCSMNWMGFTRL